MRLRQVIFTLLISSNVYGNNEQKICSPAIKPDLNNDGIVDYKDVWWLGHSFEPSKDNDRFIYKADINCDGKVNQLDWDYVWKSYGNIYSILPKVRIHIRSNDSKRIYLGRNVGIGSSIDFNSIEKPFSIKISHQITPADGLLLENQMTGQKYNYPLYGWYQALKMNSKAEKKGGNGYHWSSKFEMMLKATKVGEYQFKILAEIPESGKVIQKIIPITVLPAKKMSLNVSLSISPQYNAFEKKYTLGIKPTVQGRDVADIEKMEIIDDDNLKTYPVSHKWFSSVTVPLPKNFIENKGCKSFYIVTSTAYDSQISELVKFCADKIPLKEPMYYFPPEVADVVPEEVKTYLCQNKQLSIHTRMKEISEQDLFKIVEKAGGKIVLRQTFGSKAYMLEPNEVDDLKNWLDLMTKLSSHSEILWITFNLGQRIYGNECHLNVGVKHFKVMTHKKDD